MASKSLKKTIVFDNEQDKKNIEGELERISKLTGLTVSKIIECILSHYLFTNSMKSEIWEVIAKYL